MKRNTCTLKPTFYYIANMENEVGLREADAFTPDFTLRDQSSRKVTTRSMLRRMVALAYVAAWNQCR